MPQFQLAYAFDALIGNQGRTLDRYLYDLDPSMQARGLSLVLTGHGSRVRHRDAAAAADRGGAREDRPGDAGAARGDWTPPA